MLQNLLNRVVEIVTSETPAAKGKKSRRGSGKKAHLRHRSLQLESLETRELLSVSVADFNQIRNLYADLNLSANIGDYNVIEIEAANLSAASLKAAIAEAAGTTKSDLIVVRTTASQNTITYASSYDTLSININATNFGSVTIVSLGASPLTIDAAQKSRVMDVASSTVALAGLTITGGKTTSGGGGIYISGTNSVLMITNSTISGNTASYGGGIYNYSGTLTITNSTISGNAAASDGGGIYNYSGKLTVTNSTINGNSAGQDGGGILSYGTNATLTVTNSMIAGNSAAGNVDSAGGGGILSYGTNATLTVTNSMISGNSASNSGGIYSSGTGSTLTVTNSTISGNTAGQKGGGIYNSGTLTITNSTISGNAAASDGGGIYNYSGKLTLTNSTISGNTAGQDGGGISSNTGTLTLTNITISGNTASYGGGMYNTSGTLTLTNCTVSGNSASSYGGGIYAWANGTILLNNTIVAKNSTDIYCYFFNTVTGSNNLIGNGTSSGLTNGTNGNIVGTAANPIDPLFVMIPEVIDATTTGVNYNSANWDLRILSESPAFNAGNNDRALAAGLDFSSRDMAKQLRIMAGVIDIGAYEAVVQSIPISLNQIASGKSTSETQHSWYAFTVDNATILTFDLLQGLFSNYTIRLTGPNYSLPITATTGQFTLVNAGTYYLEVVSKNNHEGNYAFRVNTQSAQVLAIGAPFTGTMPASQYAKLFQVTTTTAGALEFDLVTASGVRAEIYVRHGSAPTRTNYEYKATSGKVLVEYAPAGTYYILVYGDFVPANSSYTLTAKLSEVVLTDFIQTGTEPGKLEFTVSGAAFDNTVKAWLVSKTTGQAVLASSTFVTSSAKMVVTFSGTFDPGDYTLRLQKGVTTVNSPKSYTVVANVVYDIKTQVIAPSSLGNNALSTLYIEYTNNGNTTVAAPIITLRIVSKSSGEERAKLTLNSSNLANGLWTSTMPSGFSNSIQILGSGATAGVLQPGETVRIPVYWAGWDGAAENDGFDFFVSVISPDNTDPLDLVAMKQSIRGTSYTDAAWEIVWSRLQSVMGTTWGSYVGMLDNVAAYLNSIDRNVRNIDELFAVAIDWANDAKNPFGTLVATNDLSVAGRDFTLNFSRSFIGSSISSRFTQAQMGFGWDHNWNWSLDLKASGDIVLYGPQSMQQLFQPDARTPGKYLASSLFVTATLVKQGTNYIYTEQSGTVYTFGSDGKLQKCVDQYGNVITFTHTGGKLTKIADAQGNSITLTYDANGNIIKSLDSQGSYVNYAYDATGKYLISVENKYRQKILYDYNQTGNTANSLRSITYPDGTVQRFIYSEQGTLTGSQTDGLEAVRIVRGNTAKTLLVYETHVGNTLIGKTYLNELGQVSREEDTQGRSTNYFYDSLGRISKVTDVGGVPVAYKYDAKGNLIGYTGTQGDSLGFKYDNKGQLLQLTDALGHKTLFSYDTFGNVKEITRQDGTKNTYTYDANGFLTEKTTRADDKYTYVYDAKGRLIEMWLSTAAKPMRYEYDANDNVVKIIDPEDRVTLQESNDRNWLTKVTQPDGRYLVYAYDDFGRRTSISDGGDYHITYSYNALGFLEYVRNGKDDSPATNLITQYFYDNLGNITKELQGNGTYTSYVYDSLGYMISKATYNGANVILASFAYVYGARGGVTTMTTLDGTWSYDYDLSGQLVGSQFASNGNNAALTSVAYVWAYDAAGNRVSQSVGGITTNYVVNAMNQITNDGTYTYEYNANGTLVKKTSKTSDESWTYTWCQGSWLYSITSSTGEKWEYDYDPYGNRTMVKHTNAAGMVIEEFHYVYDISGLGSITAVYDCAGNLLASYAYGYGLVSQTDASGNAAYYGFDHLGSTAVVTGANGAVVNQYAYDPFGGSLYKNETSTLVNPFQFVGEYGVATGQNDSLISMRARWYDPALGRFVSEDPIGRNGGDENLYRYGGNSPVILVDPTGQFVQEQITVGYGLGVTIGASLNGCVTVGAGLTTPGVSASVGGENSTSGFRVEASINIGIINLTFSKRGRLGISLGVGKGFSASVMGTYTKCFDAAILPAILGELGLNTGGVPVTRSVDPNEILGPAGYGDEGWITGNETLAYEIHFENDSKATAPAQRVDIEQYLDPNLDWSSLEFTGFGFGDVYIALAAGQYSVNQIVEMTVTPLGSTEAQTIYVEVTAGIDLAIGRIYASFQTLQYVTLGDFEELLPPFDVNIGFLLPSVLGSDDQPIDHRGMGFINYVVKPKANLQTNAIINSVAKIQFDLGEIIYTNQIDPHDPSQGTDPKLECPLTIDATKPESWVTTFTSSETSTKFTVRWSGTDVGSGVGTYDIYVSTDGITFEKWLDRTALTSAIYEGEVGKTYYFYSIAYDNVGNPETMKTASEASVEVTTVSGQVAPENLRVTAQGKKTLTLSWNKIANATEYVLERYVDGTWTQIYSGTDAQFVDTKLTVDTAYNYRVRANLVGNTSSDYGGTISGRTLNADATDVPAITQATQNPTTGFATLTWSSLGDGYTYYVVRDNIILTPSGQTTNTFTDTINSDGSVYRIQAKRSGGFSEVPPIVLSRSGNQPEIISHSISADNKVTLNWNVISGASKVVIINSGNAIVANLGGSATSWTGTLPSGNYETYAIVALVSGSPVYSSAYVVTEPTPAGFAAGMMMFAEESQSQISASAPQSLPTSLVTTSEQLATPLSVSVTMDAVFALDVEEEVSLSGRLGDSAEPSDDWFISGRRSATVMPKPRAADEFWKLYGSDIDKPLATALRR